MRHLYTFCLLFLGFYALAQPATFYFDTGLSEILDLSETPNGEIWAATPSGLAYFNAQNKNVQYFLNGTNGPAASVNLVRTRGQQIWAAGPDYLARYDSTQSQWQSFGSSDGLPANFTISDLEISPSGLVWLNLNNQLYKYNGSTFTNENKAVLSLDLLGEEVFALSRTGSVRAIEKLSNGVWSGIPGPPGIQTRFLRQIEVDKSGAVWVMDLRTLSVLAQGNWYTYTQLQRQDPFVTLDDRAYLRGSGDAILVFDQSGTLDTLPDHLHSPSLADITCLSAGQNGLLLGDSEQFSSTTTFIHTIRKIYPALVGRQEYGLIGNTKLEASFYAGGNLFRSAGANETKRLQYLGKTIGFAASVWFRAVVGNDTLLSVEKYRQRASDYYSGPAAAVYDSSYLARYNHVFVVSKAQIKAHQNRFGQANYTMPFGIAQWPANGNTAQGEAQTLAPYIDLNGNGVYEPILGEYPKIKGDQAAYFIFNDLRGPKRQSQSAPIGLEVHCLAFLYDTAVAHLNDALFLNYTIINRSGQNMSDLRTAYWNDFDIGNAFDDGIGSDSILEAFYSYNLDNDDEGPLGYGTNPPVVGGTFLSHAMEGMHYYLNTGFSNPPSAVLNPSLKKDYQRLMDFRWKDNLPLKLENPSGPYQGANGDGYSANPTLPNTRWAFNDQVNWFQLTTGSDPKLLAMADLGPLPAGESVCFNLALSTYRLPMSNSLGLDAIDSLKNQLQDLQNYYQNQYWGCVGPVVSQPENTVKPKKISAFPNPVQAGAVLFLESTENLKEIKLLSLSGQTLLEKSVTTKKAQVLLPSSLRAGVYLVQLKTMQGLVNTTKISVQ
jgi:hypothetical protein